MGPDLSAAPHAAACPACGAGLHADAQWCTLCYHDLRPAPAPAPAPELPSYGELDPLTAPLLDIVLPAMPAAAPAPVAPEAPVSAAPAPRASTEELTWPCTRCGSANPMTSPLCGTCGSAFLAEASEKVSLVVPVVGDIAHYSRGQRVGIAAVAVLAVLLPLALITFLMTPAPKQSNQGTTETTVQTVGP